MLKRTHLLHLFLLGSLLACPVGGSLRAGDCSLLVGAGIGPMRDLAPRAYGSVEVDYAFEGRPIGLWGAFDLGSKGHYLGFGPSLTLPLNKDWTVALSSGPGWFSGSGTFNLGSPLEFRSTLYVSRRLGADSRIGFSASHYSNAGIAKHNPGAETCRLFLVWKL